MERCLISYVGGGGELVVRHASHEGSNQSQMDRFSDQIISSWAPIVS